MKRGLLVLAMILSLWPVGAIAASALSESSATSAESDSSVSYDDEGGTTVAIDDQGAERKVTLPVEVGGKTYECPVGTSEKRAIYDGLAGRIEAALQDVRRDADRIEARYPDGVAPHSTVRRYSALISREKRLITRFNRAAAKSNAILESDCTAAAE
jgi:hypothetical protein